MNKELIIKFISLLMAFALCVTAFGCVRHVKDDPKPTKDPNATAEATAEVPAETEQTADSSTEPFETPSAPDESGEPDETENAPAGNTDEPAVTAEPGKTAKPEGSEPPRDTMPPTSRTQAPTNAPGPVQPGQNTPAPTDKPTAAPTNKPTPSPAPAATSTPKPTATPKPDPVTSLTWMDPDGTYYCDMNFDGKDEKIELYVKDKENGRQSVTVKVTVGGSGKVALDTFEAESYINGLINNFNSGDNRVEIVVCTSESEKDKTVRAYRLNSASSGLLKCTTPGWIESVTGNAIKLHCNLDLLGTWECTASFSFDRESFAFVRVDEKWTVLPVANRWCTVSAMFTAGIYSSGTENQAMFINPGTKLYPVATDYSSIMDLVTDTGMKIYISIEVADGRAVFEGGDSFETCFSDLNYLP